MFDADWTRSDLFGAAQVVVAILGFGLAIWQLVRTANATVASNEALQRRLLYNDLLVMLPDVHALEDGVEKAGRGGDRDELSVSLVAYSRRVSAMVGALKSDSALRDQKVTKALAAAARAAGDLKSGLYDDPAPDIAAALKPVQMKIQAASRETGEAIAALQRTSATEKRKAKAGK